MSKQWAVYFLLLLGTCSANAQSLRSTAQGVFSEEQAKRGAAAYNKSCASCHGADLRSTDREVPHLTERGFKSAWIGKTLAEKFEVTRDTMPPREERSLEDQVYLDVVTYILRFNKVPAGQQELMLAPDVLKQIVIAEPPS